MKKALFLFILCLTLGFLNAQQHYQFRTDTKSGLQLISSTADGLKLHYALSEIAIKDIDNNDAKGQEIELKGCFGSFAEGLPNLPFVNHYIAVPQGATVSVKVKEKGCKTLNGIDLLPAATLQGNAAKGTPKLRKDMSVFGKDTNYPSENAAITQTTTIRGLDVVLLNVTPFRYNPVRKTLEVIYDMDIDIRFEGGSGQFGEARYRNPAWDGILRDLVINSDMLPETHYLDLLNEAIKNRAEGCEYLIISPDDDDIVALAETVKQFRTKQGILTKVVTTTECGGNDANAIKEYIQNAYDHWAIPPAAVMLFSGVDTLYTTSTYYEASSGIPGFNLIFKNYEDGFSLRDYYYSSDNPYADMNGDSIPDIALSRLPAVTLDEYQTQVNKLIKYETNPPAQPNYYDQPIITSSYEHNKWFLITSQSVNGFFRHKLGLHPKNFYMGYGQSEPVYPDTAWSTGYNTDAVVDYFGPNGQNYIAQQPDTLKDWRNEIDISYLIDALNQSSFLTLYRDHSSFDLWCSPWIYSSEIQYLKNTEPTFVLSIGCDAALYSRYTYYESGASHIYSGQQPMVYELCKTKVGALGGIGATTVTHSHFNDILTWGFIDNAWPNFMPDMGTMNPPMFMRPAFALVAGKLFLNQHVFMPDWWPTKVTTTQNVFHYLGEAYLNLYTEVPQPMTIEAATYTNHSSPYFFTAEKGAMVCLSMGEEILSVTQATGKPQTLSIPNLPIGTHLCLTVTKQNRIRFEKDIIIIDPNLSYVYVKDFLVDSQDDNGQLEAGETADITLILHNFTTIASDQGTLTLSNESPYVEMVKSEASYAKISPESTLTLKNAFRIKISPDTPDQTMLTFMIQFNENENTHEDVFRFPVNSTVIIIEPTYSLHTMDGEPSTHIVPNGNSKLTFQILNQGHSSSAPIHAHLDIKAPFVHIEEPDTIIDVIAPGEHKEISFMLDSDDEMLGAWLQTNLHLQEKDSHHYFDTILQYSGIFERFESDTLNTNFNWRNNDSNPWTYNEEDAYEGRRCFTVTGNATMMSYNNLKAVFKGNKYLNHKANISFHYKTSANDILRFYMDGTIFKNNSTVWSHFSSTIEPNKKSFYWSREVPETIDEHVFILKIDDICFPPTHRIIAHAGTTIYYCEGQEVKVSDAYAYDCDTLYWTTDGDGFFELDNEVNPTYHPGVLDQQQAEVLLTLHAVSQTDTVNSTVALRQLHEIGTGEAITGDSVVNIFTHPLYHYTIEPQEGIIYHWELEPANAGWVYEHENQADILWNLYENHETASLTVTAENGCETALSTLSIHLVGYSTEEWHPLDIKLFPNPSEGNIHLVLGETLPGKVQVEVLNLMGECMLTRTMNDLIKGEQITIDLSSYSTGLYLVKLITSRGNYIQKVSLR